MERTGIPRALWGTQSDEVVYDLYVEAVGLGVENLNDKPDEIDPAEPAEPVRAKRGRPPLTADEKADACCSDCRHFACLIHQKQLK